MHYRKISLLLCVAMLIGILAGCSGTATPSESPATSPSDSTPVDTAPVDTTAPDDNVPPPEGDTPTEGPPVESEGNIVPEGLTLNYDDPMSIYDYNAVTYSLPLFPGEDVSFSMWVSFGESLSTFMPNQYDDNQAYLKVAEETGVNIDFKCVTSMANTEQFNLMIISQDYIDIITGVAMLYSGSYDKAIEEDEIFIDLQPIVDNYMPAYKTYYDTFDADVVRDLHTDAGYMPRLIGLNYDYAETSEGMLIRTDYLDQVGMDIPVTYDDLDAVLRAFKSELDISQPLMLSKGIVHSKNSLVSGFDVLGTFSTFPMAAAPWYQIDGEIKFGIVEDGYKDYISMIAGWYADGLISSEFMVLNDNPRGSVFVSEITSGNAGVFFGESGEFKTWVTAGQVTNPDYDISAVAEIVKEPGQVTHFAEKKSPISGRLPGIAVMTSVKDEEKLGTYLDWFFTRAGALYATVGVEGQAWEMDGNTLVYADEWLNTAIGTGEKPTYYIFSVIPALYPLQTPEEDRLPSQVAAGPIWDTNADSAYRIPEVMTLTTEEGETKSRIWNDMQTYLEENIAKFVVGEKDLSEWDAFIQDVWSMDLQTLITIYQDSLDRYNSR